MPEIRLEHITKRWGKFYGVDDLNLVIENNAFVTLLGPSGCQDHHPADDRGTGDPH